MHVCDEGKLTQDVCVQRMLLTQKTNCVGVDVFVVFFLDIYGSVGCYCLLFVQSS